MSYILISSWNPDNNSSTISVNKYSDTGKHLQNSSLKELQVFEPIRVKKPIKEEKTVSSISQEYSQTTNVSSSKSTTQFNFKILLIPVAFVALLYVYSWSRNTTNDKSQNNSQQNSIYVKKENIDVSKMKATTETNKSSDTKQKTIKGNKSETPKKTTNKSTLEKPQSKTKDNKPAVTKKSDKNLNLDYTTTDYQKAIIDLGAL